MSNGNGNGNGNIAVDVVLAFADEQYLRKVRIPVGTSIRAAAMQSIADGLFPPERMVFDPATVALGVFGQTENDEYELQAGDRIEIYRPLEQDPKEWRRQRAQVDKSRTNNK